MITDSESEPRVEQTKTRHWMLSDPVSLVAIIAVGATFYFVPWPPAYLTALVAVAALAWWQPGLTLVLVPLSAPFFDLPKQLGNRLIAPSEIFLALIALVAVGRILTHRGSIPWSELRKSPFTPPAALLLVAGLVSSLAAADKHHALQWYVELIAEPVLFYYLVLLYSRKRPLWKLYVAAVVLVGAAMALLSFVQILSGHDLSSAAGASFQRVQAAYRSPDNLGLFFDRVIPLTLAFLLAPMLVLRLRLLSAIAGALCLFSLVLTYSRGAWAAVAAACLTILFFRFARTRWLLIPLVLLVVAAFALKGPSLAHAFQSGHAGTVHRRLDIWTSSERMLRDHAILGIGPDNFIHYYAPVSQSYIQCPHGLGYMEPEAWQEPCLSHPHNVFLDFWLSTGLLGLISFFWIQIVFWRLGWRKMKQTLDAPFVVGALGAMLAGLLHGLVDNSYFLIDLSLLFWLFCAVLTCARLSPAAGSNPFEDATGHA